MENRHLDLTALYSKLITKTISDEELYALIEYFHTGDPVVLQEMIRTELDQEGDGPALATLQERKALDRVFEQVRPVQEVVVLHDPTKLAPVNRWRQIMGGITAAAILLLAMTLGWQYFFVDTDPDDLAVHIVPGQTAATLTLGDGRQIVLADSLQGLLAKESGFQIYRNEQGEIFYELAGDTDSMDANPSTRINTLTTAAGQTFQIRLPDGSLVALNAASQITYSTGLKNQATREIMLSGEAYFEIAKDADRPFLVKTSSQTLRVLGTHFNVKAYPEDPIETTLLEGSVQVEVESKTVTEEPVRAMLIPGQQSILHEGRIHIATLDTEPFTAWRDGYFQFSSERLESVMKQLSRWYDLKIVFVAPDLKDETFVGSISRYETVQKVLQMLEITDVARFEVRDRTIYIRKK